MFFHRMRKWFQPTPQSRSRRPRAVLGLEILEDRLVPAVYNVISTADGAGALTQTGANTFNATTLRAAITAANANPGNNTINLVAPGTYLLTQGQLQIFTNPAKVVADETLTINNTSGGTAIVSGGGVSRVFDINPTNTALPIDAKTGAHVLVTFNNFTITDGFASDLNNNPDGPNASGGGIRDQNNVDLTLNRVTLTRNVATADGGGISMENTVSTPWKLTINNSIISNNQAGDAGGGVETDGSGKVFLNNDTITGNTSVNQGAGIWLDAIQVGNVFQGANLTVTNTTISNNSAITVNAANNNIGGGIGNAGNGTITIIGSTVAHNFSGGVGGGFADENAQGTLIVTNSTFVGNSAIGQGGGFFLGGPSTTINNSTITGNISQAEGGGLTSSSTSFTLNNTIVAQNLVNNTNGMNFLGAAPDVFATVTSGNGNFIGIGDGNLSGISNGTNGNMIGTAANPLNPRLGPLQNNGGLTLTRTPLPGSLLLGTGVIGSIPAGTTTDQRGSPRTVNNKVDIGAVETTPAGFLVAEFPGYGVFQFSTATGVWKNLTPVNASVLASDAAGDVVAELPGYGVFRYLNATAAWTQLTPANASLLGMDSAGDVFAEFQGFGVQRFQTATGWVQLDRRDASVLAVDGNGDVAADLAGQGVFLFTAATGTWKNLTPVNANLLAIDNQRDVVAGYNGFGIYRYTVAAGTFTQLTPLNASQLSLDAAGDVFAAIPGAGLFRLLNLPGATFTQLTPANASQLAVDAAGDVFAEFPGFGVQGLFANATTFGQLTPLDASLLGAG